jgi:hypothetical protein
MGAILAKIESLLAELVFRLPLAQAVEESNFREQSHSSSKHSPSTFLDQLGI